MAIRQILDNAFNKMPHFVFEQLIDLIMNPTHIPTNVQARPRADMYTPPKLVFCLHSCKLIWFRLYQHRYLSLRDTGGRQMIRYLLKTGLLLFAVACAPAYGTVVVIVAPDQANSVAQYQSLLPCHIGWLLASVAGIPQC